MHDMKALSTDIPGLLILRLRVQHNDVGWFKEDWHREKMAAIGLPDFRPVQHNFTHNDVRGITRGFHAEPWDRLISLVSGRAMGAWVDLREGTTFGKVVTCDLDPGTAVFVPRGIANAHQVLEDHTTFSYLLNHHWTAEARARFSGVNPYDPALGISWPIPREQADLGRADTQLPRLADAMPMQPRKILVVGTETSLGKALLPELHGAVGISGAALHPTRRAEFPVDLSAFDTIISAQGGTVSDVVGPHVDRPSWTSVAEDARHIADIARRHRMRHVHISTDCTFERTAPVHGETDALSLLDAHSQGLAISEVVAATVPRHLLVRTGWVVGTGEHALTELVAAARHDRVVDIDDVQHGRLTFASTLASGILHLLDSGAASGSYNLTGEGPLVTWAEIARRVYRLAGNSPERVRRIPSVNHRSFRGSALDLTRIRATGFRPGNSWLQLADHVNGADGLDGPAAGLDAAEQRTVGTAAFPTHVALGDARPFRVLFVCTANICRSAYAEAVADGMHLAGLEFSSAGTHALTGQKMDPPIAAQLGASSATDSHRAQQLTHELVSESDIVLTMSSEHRRYILDDWPQLANKVFMIGQVAREMAQLPEAVTLHNLTLHLWKHRTAAASDDVADPYRRGPEVAASCASVIDDHVNTIVKALTQLIGEMEHS